jgi:hypothetical protein
MSKVLSFLMCGWRLQGFLSAGNSSRFSSMRAAHHVKSPTQFSAIIFLKGRVLWFLSK